MIRRAAHSRGKASRAHRVIALAGLSTSWWLPRRWAAVRASRKAARIAWVETLVGARGGVGVVGVGAERESLSGTTGDVGVDAVGGEAVEMRVDARGVAAFLRAERAERPVATSTARAIRAARPSNM
jgi:hypothetical protein